jgi:hypothetical protein
MTDKQDVLAEALRNALPYVQDEARKYADDGSNEPLELVREIEELLAAHHESAQPASVGYDCDRTDLSAEALQAAIEAKTLAQPASVLPKEYELPGTWGSRGTGTVTAIRVNGQMFIPTNEDGGVYLSREAAMQFFGFTAQPASVADDRAMLLNLMQQFDSQSWECPRCGHGEDCATMDMASELRNYLAAPQPPAKENENGQ